MIERLVRWVRKQLRDRRIAKAMVAQAVAKAEERDREYGRVSMEQAEAAARAMQARKRNDTRGFGELSRRAEALQRQRLRLEVGR